MSAARRPAPAPPPDAFRFGRNWRRYVDTYLDPDRERIAVQSLRDLVGDVEGKTFLDIGCGSGLFSLSAYRAGAKRVVSFDVDPDSVTATRTLRERSDSPENWIVLHGSILDSEFVATIEAADVVYSWGVLHHTGDMNTAIANAAGLTRPGGIFAIAIYNRVTGRWLDSNRWWRIKRAYNRAPAVGQRVMELTYGLYWSMARVRDRQNPVRLIREYRQSRGMAFRTDIMDWLGGYPYEFATAAEIRDLCEKSLGLRCVKVIELGPLDNGNNEFVFARPRG